ncbi:lipopolysaccharide biosynthesis protein [Enterococcus sp. DIV1317a]|uniref:lipopolysaccharide biosynthesis protein n=1 Tax=Enterococcus sp. DIV1317a TaxID=2774818 RepID=UPI003F25A3E1
MNEKAKTLLKNLNYTVSANFLVLGISVILNLLVPKFIGVKEYSFWQLYVFYSSYVGFFHFGWLDGIYLKIGGAEYEDLDKRSLGTQFWYLATSQTIIGLLLMVYTVFQDSGGDKSIILIFTALNLIVTNIKYFSLYVMQSTNRIKEYAQISRGDRYIYIITVGLYLLFNGRSFVPLIALDVISKLIMLLWGLYKIKDMLFVKFTPFKKVVAEIKYNIKIGSNLMISSIAGMLILGINRVMVERQWSIETFGKLSFTLSISNMFMTFINAVGIVMFPLLRRTKKENLPILYRDIRNVFVPLTYSFLLFFIPVKIILNLWLPEYSQSLLFMGILFPMVIYEGRMALLVSTYLKTIRKEKLILLSNIVTLLISTLLSFISIYIIKDIYIAVFTVMFSLAFRCIFAEKLLLNVMNLNVDKETVIETLLTSIFIIANVFAPQVISFIIYLLAFFVYLMINQLSIKSSARVLINLMKD